jgi:hypothetical protein
MIKPERLPDQVIARFDHAFLEERQSGWTLDMAYRHAFAAGLAAWPGVGLQTSGRITGSSSEGEDLYALDRLILPLKQEPRT